MADAKPKHACTYTDETRDPPAFLYGSWVTPVHSISEEGRPTVRFEHSELPTDD